LTISADGNHLAWAARVGSSATTSEDVFHLDVATNTVRQASVSAPTGQTVTDGSIMFTCNPPTGLTWSIGTGTTNLPLANARVEWAPLGRRDTDPADRAAPGHPAASSDRHALTQRWPHRTADEKTHRRFMRAPVTGSA
jgi:hypothetical protein